MSLSLSKKVMAVKPSSTLAITAKANEMKAQGIDVVGFGAGEPDFNTPKNVCDAAIDAINAGFTKYTPASGTNELKEAISKKFKSDNGLYYAPSQIVISNGGKHSLSNVFDAILNTGDEVIIPVPYWLSYPEMVKLSDGVPVYLETNKEQDYKITAKQLRAAVTEKTKAFILNSPSNPTGMMYTRQELEEIAKVAVEKDFYVVSDEIYECLVYGKEKHISIASLNEEIYKRTITCGGLSKSHSMTGWRIGFTGSPANIAKSMGALQSHATSNPNSIAQKAAVAALTGPDDAVVAMREEFERRKNFIYKAVNDMPLLSAPDPMGAFYLFVDCTKLVGRKYKDKIIADAADVAQILLEDYAVAVVPCADFGAANHIRLSYAISLESIKKGMERIGKFVGEM